MADGAAGGPDWAGRRARVARDLLERMVAHVAAGGTTDRADGPMRRPAATYVDEARFTAEMKALFGGRYPLVAGLSCDLPSPGDRMLFEDTGIPILIVRGGDGQVRAFLNACPHRAARLVETEPCPKGKLITCPFHAWSFDLTGALVAQPGAGAFDDRPGLIPVPAAEWGGIIFVRPAPGETHIDVEGHLGAFAPELAQLELAGAEPVKAGVLTADANWKYALDTYGEGYHFGTLHASSIGQTHYTDVAVYDRFGPHHRVNFPDKGVAALIGRPPESWPATAYGGVHFLFPNTVFFVGAITPGKTFVQVFRLFPDAVDRMHTRFAVYAPAGVQDDAHRAECEMAYDGTATVVTTEDYRVASRATANLKSAPAGFALTFGANEIALQNLHRAIDAALEAAP